MCYYFVEFELLLSTDMVMSETLADMSKHVGKHGLKVYPVVSGKSYNNSIIFKNNIWTF